MRSFVILVAAVAVLIGCDRKSPVTSAVVEHLELVRVKDSQLCLAITTSKYAEGGIAMVPFDCGLVPQLTMPAVTPEATVLDPEYMEGLGR